MTCFSIQKYLHIFALALIFLAGPAAAQEDNIEKSTSPLVIELFTTTDCTACIFADKLLYESMKDENVIALSCFIKDIAPLDKTDQSMAVQNTDEGPADPCAFRQWSYMAGKTQDGGTIQIPGFIINGAERIDTIEDGTYFSALKKYKRATKNHILDVMIQWKDEDTLKINLPQEPYGEKVSASVWLIRYKDMAVEKIDEGMNKGRVLRFSNIIQDIRHVAKWHGDMRSIDVDVIKPQGGKESGGYAILASEMMGSEILAAGKISDYLAAEEKSVSKP